MSIARQYMILQAELEKLRSESAELRKQAAEKDAEIARRKAQVALAQSNNHKRNLDLDALHYVWCSGGCAGGVHRFGEHPPLTEEIVLAAINNTDRLVRWLANRQFRDRYTPSTFVIRREAEEKIAAQAAEIERLQAAYADADRRIRLHGFTPLPSLAATQEAQHEPQA